MQIFVRFMKNLYYMIVIIAVKIYILEIILKIVNNIHINGVHAKDA